MSSGHDVKIRWFYSILWCREKLVPWIQLWKSFMWKHSCWNTAIRDDNHANIKKIYNLVLEDRHVQIKQIVEDPAYHTIQFTIFSQKNSIWKG